MVTGCGVSLIAAVLTGGLLVMSDAPTPQARMQRAFLGMTVRLVVVIALSLAAALSGQFERPVLLFWMAVAYIALLPLEVRLAIL